MTVESTEVRMGTQVLNVTMEFQNAAGQRVAAPENTGSNYVWSLGKTSDEAVVELQTTETGCKLTPVKNGADTLTLTVTLADGETQVTGTLQFEVKPAEDGEEGDQTPARIVLTGVAEES